MVFCEAKTDGGLAGAGEAVSYRSMLVGGWQLALPTLCQFDPSFGLVVPLVGPPIPIFCKESWYSVCWCRMAWAPSCTAWDLCPAGTEVLACEVHEQPRHLLGTHASHSDLHYAPTWWNVELQSVPLWPHWTFCVASKPPGSPELMRLSTILGSWLKVQSIEATLLEDLWTNGICQPDRESKEFGMFGLVFAHTEGQVLPVKDFKDVTCGDLIKGSFGENLLGWAWEEIRPSTWVLISEHQDSENWVRDVLDGKALLWCVTFHCDVTQLNQGSCQDDWLWGGGANGRNGRHLDDSVCSWESWVLKVQNQKTYSLWAEWCLKSKVRKRLFNVGNDDSLASLGDLSWQQLAQFNMVSLSEDCRWDHDLVGLELNVLLSAVVVLNFVLFSTHLFPLLGPICDHRLQFTG